MKKLLIIAALAFAPMVAHADLKTGIPNGIITGTEVNSNSMVMTPTAFVYMPIPLIDVRLNDGFTMMAATSISTAVYLGAVTGVSNAAAVTFPAVTGSGGAVNFQIPFNYRSGGVIQVLAHVSTTITLGQVSMTADVYVGQSVGLTSVAKTAGTAVQVPVNSLQVFNWVTLTNAATYLPGDSVQVKLLPTGTTARIEVVAIRFKYRGWGVVNGTVTSLPLGLYDHSLYAILKRSRGILTLG